jgi:hypothetical protein
MRRCLYGKRIKNDRLQVVTVKIHNLASALAGRANGFIVYLKIPLLYE